MFIASDVFKINDLENCFDIVICHDVLEHIDNKERFLIDLKNFYPKMELYLCLFLHGKCLLEDISKFVKVG